MFRAMRLGDRLFIRELVTLIVDMELLPAVEGGLVMVVHVCIHVFVLFVMVECSGNRIGCGVGVDYFGFVPGRNAGS